MKLNLTFDMNEEEMNKIVENAIKENCGLNVEVNVVLDLAGPYFTVMNMGLDELVKNQIQIGMATGSRKGDFYEFYFF